jgi:hypothetical protein
MDAISSKINNSINSEWIVFSNALQMKQRTLASITMFIFIISTMKLMWTAVHNITHTHTSYRCHPNMDISDRILAHGEQIRRHWTPSWASWMQSAPLHLSSPISFLILLSHIILRIGLPFGHFPPKYVYNAEVVHANAMNDCKCRASLRRWLFFCWVNSVETWSFHDAHLSFLLPVLRKPTSRYSVLPLSILLCLQLTDRNSAQYTRAN